MSKQNQIETPVAAATPCSACGQDRLKRLADDWLALAADEMNGAVQEKYARDGMNFYQHTARAAVLSDCRKQLMEIILPNSELSQPETLMDQAAETQCKAVEWHALTDQGLRLRCGELTAQEIRTVRAVLAAILSQPNETSPSADTAP